MLIGSLMLFWSAASPAHDRALLVGIDRYQNNIRPLFGAVNDAHNMTAFVRAQLRFAPQYIETLLDEQATRAAILTSLRQLISDTGPGDRVLFYYSGHGYQTVDLDGDEADGYDETLVSIDTYQDADGEFRNMVLDDELALVFDRLNDRQVTIIIDSCHSGTATRSFNADDQTLGKSLSLITGSLPQTRLSSRSINVNRNEKALLESTPTRIVWSAVSAYQKALEDVLLRPRGGAFTNYFLAGLRDRQADRDGDGVVSYIEQLDYVRARSNEYCRYLGKQKCPLGLTPTLEIDHTRLQEAPFSLAAAPAQSIATKATQLFSYDNNFQLSLEILEGNRLLVNDTMTYRITSEQDGYLLLLDINARGEAVQIYPNDICQDQVHRLQSGQPLLIPENAYSGCRFRAVEPRGKGRLIALVTQDPVQLDDITGSHKDLEIIPQDTVTDYLGLIAERLRQPWTMDQFNRPAHWASAVVNYEIR
jgi:hypothetical protein